MPYSQPLSVLVVDDHPDTAESLAACLRFFGFDVRTATSGPAGLALLDGWVPDVAVLDLAMPGMTGYELAGHLCEAMTQSPLLIALTGLASPDDRERARASGFDHFLVKPVDLLKLEGVLRAVVPAT